VASLPGQLTRPCAGLCVLCLSGPALPRVNQSWSARLGAVYRAVLYSVCLEKRSQALQACNLTRNIQADGAPMVHLAPGISPPGVFSYHRTPELCLRKRSRIVAQGRSFKHGSVSGSARLLSLRFIGQSMSPSHLSGTLLPRSMKIRERSNKDEAGSFISRGTPHSGSRQV